MLLNTVHRKNRKTNKKKSPHQWAKVNNAYCNFCIDIAYAFFHHSVQIISLMRQNYSAIISAVVATTKAMESNKLSTLFIYPANQN